jgi:predicted RNase H-like HicB family nuclease
MRKGKILTKYRGLLLPLIVEKDENGFYVVECPILEGCYSQGKTIDEALKNIREAIELVLEEKNNQEILRDYRPKELSLHTITL